MFLEIMLGIFVFGWLGSTVMAYRRSLVLARASEAWPKVRGQVVASRLEDGEAAHGFPKIEYAYNVGGQDYHASAIAYGLPADRRGFFAALRCHEGDVVWVHYNPQNPAQAVLHPGGSTFQKLLAEPQALVTMLFTSVLAVAFVALLLRDLLA
ncbi:DUF3592 domain-containing protein [Chloroflexia bacterium SDU3-3]|nr:DUF3592 domain-containing protein [Chloroflexia bacterium SDU3-3]